MVTCGCAGEATPGGCRHQRQAARRRPSFPTYPVRPPPPFPHLALGHGPPPPATAVRGGGPAGGDDDINDLLAAASRLLSRLAAGTSAWARRNGGTPEGRALLTTVAVNTAVFAAWRLAPPAVMARHFTLTPAAVTAFWRRGHTLVTAFFSHASGPHYAANMYMLVSFAPAFVATLPASVDAAHAFAAVYLGGGLAGSGARLATTAASAAWSPRGRVPPPASLGASGAVLALVYSVAAAAPDTRVAVLGVLPSTLGEVAVGGAVLNVIGAVRGWARIDWAAHVGGSAWGATAGWWVARERERATVAAREREGLGGMLRRASQWVWGGGEGGGWGG
ncbi:hypothetical protein MMPV_001172 [Pyropia vietnamensis]